MSVYEKVYNHLKRLEGVNEKLVRLCPAKGPCACMGCAGSIDGIMINQRFIDMYKSGELEKALSRQKRG